MTEKDIALSEFSKVWKKFQDAKLLAEFVNDKYPFFKEVTEFLVEWFTKSKRLVAKQKKFCDCIFTLKDYSYALDIFERLNAKGMNVHTLYVAVILKAIPTLDADEKLQLINRGLSKFTDANLLQEKYDVATLLIINGDLDKAKSVLQELVGHHKDAEPSLALVAYKNYKKVQSLDKKEEYLTECLSFDTKHSNPFDQETYNPTFVKALKSFIDVIDKHVKTDNISEARRLCLSLKSYSSDWYEKYLVIVAGYLSKIAASNEIAASIYSCFDTLSANEVDIKNLNSDIIIGLWDSLFKAELTNAQEMTYEDSISHLQELCTYVSEKCYAKKKNDLLKNITSKLVAIHFNAGKPDDAYIVMKRYSVYNDGLYDSYISILKDYKDTEYVLSKLQFLRNSGKDIKADYIEVVDKLCKQAKIANKYKQELLARTYDLFKDNTIYNKYISTSISLIKEMTEKDIALSEFSKVWKKFQDAKLLAEFVNDKYPFFKEVTEFLVEWFTKSKRLVAKQKEFCDCIFTLKDYSYALDIFERLNAKGMYVHTLYVAVILKAIPTLDADEKLQLINRGLSKFTDANLLQEKYDVATLLIINGDLDKAKSVLQELIGHHKDAEPSLALVAYKNYKKVQSLDKKEEYLTECLSFDTKHSNPFDQETYKPTFVKALKSFIDVIDKHVKTDNISEARRLCLSLKSYSSDWYEKYLVIVAGYLSKIAASNEIAASIYSCFDTLSANEVDIKNLNSDIIIGLWDSLFKAELTNAQEMPYEDSISHLQKLSTYVSEKCYAKNDLLKNITSDLIAIHKKEGYKQEGAGNIDKAISSYNCLSSVGDVRSKTWAKIRTTICQLKKGTSLKEKDVLKVLSYVGFAKEKKDLSYRYGIWLIKNTGAKNALDFIKEHLPDEDELIDICNNEYIVEAEASLAELNASIEEMSTGKMSLSDATKLASKIDSYDATISPYLENVHSKIISLKGSIQSYILSKSFEEGDYKLALKLLKDTGASWFLDDIYFRNVAIACLGIAENGLLNKLNYKEVISYWLTAVYRD